MADALLTIENLSKSFGDKMLFDNISFGINVGQKTALIARNGYGKSTLLNIITGKELPDNGNVTFSGNVKMAYLPQRPDFNNHQTVRSFVDSAEKPANMESWDFEQRMEEVLSRLEVDKLLDRSLDSLSGGEQKKVALCRILIDNTNLLLLDEPTNHLDIAMIEWLEDFLSKQKLAILMVTHDRYFLDNVCNDILELDNGNIYYYRSSRGLNDIHKESPYRYYLEKRRNDNTTNVLKWRKQKAFIAQNLTGCDVCHKPVAQKQGPALTPSMSWKKRLIPDLRKRGSN